MAILARSFRETLDASYTVHTHKQRRTKSIKAETFSLSFRNLFILSDSSREILYFYPRVILIKNFFAPRSEYLKVESNEKEISWV